MSDVNKTILISLIVGVIAAFVYFLSSSPSDHNVVIHEHCKKPENVLISSSYKSNVNSLLTSFVNSSSVSAYNNFTVGSNPNDTVYGLYQCRGHISYGSDDCFRCVTQAVRRLRSICADAQASTMQLKGCIVRYDNVTFIGVPDKTLVVNRCELPYQYKPDEVARTNALLRSLVASYGSSSSYRVGRSVEAEAVAQCTEDLSAIDCQDCLIEAILWRNPFCGKTGWGEVYLAKCYLRYSSPGASGYEFKKTFGSTRRQLGDELKSFFDRGQEFIFNIIMSLLTYVFWGFLFWSMVLIIMEN